MTTCDRDHHIHYDLVALRDEAEAIGGNYVLAKDRHLGKCNLLQQLMLQNEAARASVEAVDRLARIALKLGYSQAAVGGALGISRQAVHQRWSLHHQ